jgi:hypothetical protein
MSHIKLKDLISKEGHISKYNPARAFAPTVDEGVADDDMAAAEKMKNDLLGVYDDIDDAVGTINKKLSSFNSPGLRVAFLDGIKAGAKNSQKWNHKAAESKLEDYFDR